MITGSFDTSLIRRLERIRTAFDEGILGEKSHEEHPGLARDSRENYIYFTLAPALNFQRRSEQLWRAAVTTHRDITTTFVFEPRQVCETSDDELRTALTKHALATRPVRHTDTWRKLCGTLTSRYGGDPRAFFEDCEWDVLQILEALKNNRQLFPVVSGPKMSSYWLFIISRFTDARLRNKQEISIIPDTHVRRASAYLGVVSDVAEHKTEKLADLWRIGLQGSGISPSELHGPLWLWSRAGFPEL